MGNRLQRFRSVVAVVIAPSVAVTQTTRTGSPIKPRNDLELNFTMFRSEKLRTLFEVNEALWKFNRQFM